MRDATNATDLQQPRTEAALVFGPMVPIAWAIPALVVLCCRCRRRSPSSASRPSSLKRAQSSHLPSESSLIRALNTSEAAAAQQRLRVAGTAAQLGWMMCSLPTLVVVCFLSTLIRRETIVVTGYFMYYFTCIPWGLSPSAAPD